MGYRRGVKKRILAILALFGAWLSSTFFSLGVMGAFYELVFFDMGFEWWIALSAIFFLGAFAALFFVFTKEEKPTQVPPKFPEYEKFMKECKLSFRGTLKISILFWILAYRKEKAKSFEDAKKQVFLEVKKEIPHVRWMDAILSEVHEELSKVKQ